MKIALVLDDTLDKPDGVQQYVTTLGSWLSQNGHTVYYLCANTTRSDLQNIISLGHFLSTKFNGNSVRTPLPNLSRIRQIISDIDPDVIHVQMPYSPLLGGRVISAAPPKAAVVGTFHILPASRSKYGLNRGLGLLLKPTLRRFDAAMAVSRPAADFAKSAYGLSCAAIPNPIDLSRFHVRPTPQPNSVVFLGRLVDRKGVLDLIRAYNDFPDDLARTSRLIIGGAGPLLSQAKRLVAPNRSVEFKGFIEESDKPAFLASASLAVFPSTSGESFGIVLLEAMAAGATVLAAKNPGYESVLEKVPKALFKPKDPKALTEALVRFLSDSALKDQVQKAQSALVSQYDITVVGPKIVQVYTEALASRSRI